MDIPIAAPDRFSAADLLPIRSALVLGLAVLAAAASCSSSAAVAAAAADDDESAVGRSFQVPYRLTETNHFLVRLRINGKGPFNFLVDTGAPAFFISTETARKIDLKPAEDSFWTRVERVDFEGGARLRGLRARIEDPFQLVGMNALGLPGASIDGLIGYTVLARFRIELNPTKDRMTWTRLDFNPVDPPIPRRAGGGAPELQAMNAIGPLAKGLAFLMGKQAEDQLHPRGFLGLEWSEARSSDGDGAKPKTAAALRIDRVLEGSPAARAGVRPGDLLVRLGGKPVTDKNEARAAIADLSPGRTIELTVRRAEKDKSETRDLTLTVTAGEGL